MQIRSANPGITSKEANGAAWRQYNYGETTEAFPAHYGVAKAKLPPGSTATSPATRPLAWGLIAAAGRPAAAVLGSYPITPASDILHDWRA